MKIIVFLGNPGKKYRHTRHNAGFLAGDYLCRKFSIKTNKKDFSSVTGKGEIMGIQTTVIFPQTFMNQSGLAVKAALDFYRTETAGLIVVHDEIELSFGEIKTRLGGGHKGHNGIRSIIQHAGTADFFRVKIGVGRPENPDIEIADYLLSDFFADELQKLNELMPVIAEKITETVTA